MSQIDEYVDLLTSIDNDLNGRQIDRLYTDDNRDAYQSHLNVFRAGNDFRERCMFGGCWLIALNIMGLVCRWVNYFCSI
jgi:hypothetical protein